MNFWADTDRLFEIMEPEKQLEFDALSSISSGRSEREFSPGVVFTPPVSTLFDCYVDIEIWEKISCGIGAS